MLTIPSLGASSFERALSQRRNLVASKGYVPRAGLQNVRRASRSSKPFVRYKGSITQTGREADMPFSDHDRMKVIALEWASTSLIVVACLLPVAAAAHVAWDEESSFLPAVVCLTVIVMLALAYWCHAAARRLAKSVTDPVVSTRVS